MLCSLVDGQQCFRGSCCLRIRGRSSDCLSLEGRGSKFFQNVGTCVMEYMASHPTSQYLNWSGYTENLKISRDKSTFWREMGIIPASVHVIKYIDLRCVLIRLHPWITTACPGHFWTERSTRVVQIKTELFK